MLYRILWSAILVSTLYVLAVFFVPKAADDVATMAGIRPFNEFLRNFQKQIEGGAAIHIQEGSGYINQAREVVSDAQKTIDSTKDVLGEKAKQIDTVIDSGKKAANSVNEAVNSIYEVKKSAETLLSTSGATKTESGSSN